MKIGNYWLEGGGCCPEQYDVFRGKDGERVAYLRLRHGIFRADIGSPGENGHVRGIYEAHPEGDGSFNDHEREKFLTEAIEAIDRFLKQD